MVGIFDIGGSNIRLAIADKSKIISKITHPTSVTQDGFEHMLEFMDSFWGEATLDAVVGGLAGQLDGEEGTLRVAGNLSEWKGIAIRQRMRDLLGLPVEIRNDIEMTGLGEAFDGAGISKGVMAYFTVSTGVNAVRIIDGNVDPRVGWYELGAQIIDHRSGEAKHLEQLIGGASMQRRFGVHPKLVRDPAVWLQEAAYLAAAVYNSWLYWGVERVVLGGSMMRDISIDEVENVLHEFPQVQPNWPVCVAAKLGDEAGLRGAIHVANERGWH